MTHLSAEVRTLRAAYKALSKRGRAKKACVRQDGALTVGDAKDILTWKDVDARPRRIVRTERGSWKEGQSSGRRCGTCEEAGHNVRTCQVFHLCFPDDSREAPARACFLINISQVMRLQVFKSKGLSIQLAVFGCLIENDGARAPVRAADFPPANL